MKKSLLLVLIMLVALFKGYSQGLCDTAYWNHTYTNSRLKIYDSCTFMTGTIHNLVSPALNGDGDYHIYVEPDSAYEWMQVYRDTNFVKLCNSVDSAYTLCSTCLNVEEICKGAITDGGTAGAIENAACNGFNDTVYLPNIGEHVKVVGPYVFDIDHCWNEIHPVSTMLVIPTAGINEINGAALIAGLKIFPQPAANDIKFQFDRAPRTLTLIKLYNIKGQQLYVYALYQTTMLDVDISTWPAGDYLYSIVLRDQNQVLRSGKFSVVH